MTHDSQNPVSSAKLSKTLRFLLPLVCHGGQNVTEQEHTVSSGSWKPRVGELVPTVRKQAGLPTEQALQCVPNKDDIGIFFFSVLGPHVSSCHFLLHSTFATNVIRRFFGVCVLFL